MVRHVLGLSGSLSLLILPGAWLAFSLALPGSTALARAALAVVLSPAVALAEFHLLRWAGLGFDATAVALVAVNLPALLVIARRRPIVTRPRAATAALWIGPLLIVAAYLLLWLLDTETRANWRHNWLHTDIIYMLANGQLRPEEPLLAGVRLAYPWAGHVFQGLVSHVRGTPPNSSFMLTNTVWLFAVLVFAIELTRDLGGRLLAQVSAVGLLCFGVNFLGPVGQLLLPAGLVESLPVGLWGDVRYTPWLRKFGIFESTLFGIGIFAALAYLLVRSRRPAGDRSSIAAAAVLIVSAGLLYPILWPASAALVGAYVLVHLDRWRVSSEARRDLTLLAGSVIAGLVTLASYLRLITPDRAGDATLGVTTPYEMKVKVAALAVVMAPLWLTSVFSLVPLWRAHRRSLLTLGLAVAGLAVQFVVFDIYNVANEYKFVFVAAFCLVPLSALAVGKLAERLGPAGWALPLVVTVVLAYPALRSYPRDDSLARPRVDLGQFDLRLQPVEPLAGLLDTIRTATPVETVVVSRLLPFDLTTLAQRPLYVPFVGGQTLLGLGLSPDYLLLRSRGYPGTLLDDRRALVRQLYEATDDEAREQALAAILNELNRPITLIVDRPGDAAVEAWLERRGARSVYADTEAAAWLVTPGRSDTDTES